MQAPTPYSPIDRKTSADHEPAALPWLRSLLFWLVVLAAAGVVVVTALSARALGTHTGRHAYPHVLAEPGAAAHTADATNSVAMLPLHDIERHFSALVDFAGVLGMPIAIPLMAVGIVLLALAVFLIYRPRRQEIAPRREVSQTSRRRRARKT